MALFKSQEEREEDARRRAEEERQEAARLEERRRAAAEAAFAHTPIGRARTAFRRGDRYFQAELEVSSLTGEASMFGSSENEITRRDEEPDLLGRIEDEGWRLEHAGYVFVETGSTSTDRVFLSGQGTVTRGVVTGVYLFRRAEPAGGAEVSPSPGR
ncbi:hypothetical protein [Amnibacterium kyonggiense]|uniref:Uncharacterized protein n=1 Tax=Amnibacterium kyonggiense TaxID=595671 RepID=A0A4R7FLJ3_9MICO|nr:hypothetical protein [Amnibacterium kyonggiense]TDS77275.1 hypothetical protein CLV52_2218 [Amnibacterium kyonggiense]